MILDFDEHCAFHNLKCECDASADYPSQPWSCKERQRLFVSVMKSAIDLAAFLDLPLGRTYNLTMLVRPSASSRTPKPITLAVKRRMKNEIKWSRPPVLVEVKLALGKTSVTDL